MNLPEPSLILPFTKKYGPLGEITFLMQPVNSFTMPANAAQIMEYSSFQAHWVDKGNNKGTVYATFNDIHYLVMRVTYNTPSPQLLIDLGFKEILQ